MNHPASARLVFLASLFIATTIPSVVPATTIVFQDGTFPNASWSTVVEGLNAGGTGSGVQVASGGNPGSYRRATNTTNSAIGTGVSNTVYVFHVLAGAVHNPSTAGPIASIDYSEASIHTSGGVQACGLALRQGGVIFYGPSFLNPTTLNVWATSSQTGLTAASFDAVAPGLQTPDFTSSGGPIQFGFYRANSTSVGGAGSTTVGGIDNEIVTLTVTQPVPVTPSTWGGLKALHGK